ncbi:oligosaccharyl transferase subunit Dad1, putative [Paecilomyces variotii No. 5]|uniref:Dolichyl-diphosphooligosaccharide--protein glycosyltransferase subunit OST2 n=1 Tax=Byssochlamys spectabilis (strain No. 5 / NBRC 109023) TaxID=1356009 RepID=V5FLK1_BYSSN|nr:oligosaccharyl transferase subunit Dad1, putative [Paecilomyces variotii No. 5]
MAPKKQAGSSTPAASSATSAKTTGPSPSAGAVSLSPNSNVQEIVVHIWKQYIAKTPQRTLLLDAFMGFLVLVGVVQFVYCVLAGNYPFNAFLSGFCAAVGQFVLTASLRMQTSDPTSGAQKTTKGKTGKSNAVDDEKTPSVSPERAFADYVFGSIILHFFCINFIN